MGEEDTLSAQSTPSNLRGKISSGQFIVTSELTPPKGTDLGALYAGAEQLVGSVDAVNITDSAGARMAACPLAVATLLAQHGMEPIMQMTARDRNRIALQGDMLGAQLLGIKNLVVMGGDPPKNGDHPEAKPVFDLFASDILKAAASLNNGTDMMGNELKGSTSLYLGAVVNPGADDLDGEIQRMEDKINAGAQFFQTQAVYDVERYVEFAKRVAKYDVAFLAGIIPLKSKGMANFLNEKVPGITVPDDLIDEIDSAADKEATAVDIAARIVSAVKPHCQGVHMMAMGWDHLIPAIIAASEK